MYKYVLCFSDQTKIIYLHSVNERNVFSAWYEVNI